MNVAIDIQMITQYGQGSGTAFGFTATRSIPPVISDHSNREYLSMSFWFKMMLGLHPLPDVISISSGGTISLSVRLAAFDATMAKFAAMGITVLVSSGDAGR